MAVVVHYVERTPDASDFTINGIRGVILAIENTVDTTPALIQARTITLMTMPESTMMFPMDKSMPPEISSRLMAIVRMPSTLIC